MDNNFDILLLNEASEFIEKQSIKAQKKIVYNLQKARKVNDPKLFKKLNDVIWEFRTEFAGQQYRLFAFWDDSRKAFVVCTHGIIKKSKRTPKKEITKAEKIRNTYLNKQD